MSSAPTREVAKRAFATELSSATEQFQESDDDRAPKFSLLPTGDKANRVFTIATVTETEDVGSDTEYWKARLRDPSGAIYAYAGEYQPDAMAAIKDLDVPEHVAVTAKLSTFETDEGDTLVSLRPESIEVVGETERSRWIEETARFTLDRIEAFDDLSNDNEYAERAADSYGDLTDDILDDTIDILRECNWTAAADSVDDEDGDED